MTETAIKKVPSLIGSSNCSYLHAHFKLRIYKNGEALAFASVSAPKISGNFGENGRGTDENKSPKVEKIGRKPGKVLAQNGLTSYAKRCMRVLAHEYQEMVVRPHSEFEHAYCSFSTLSFRRMLPQTDLMAKEIFRAYLERIRRKYGNIHYVWCAELQRGQRFDSGKASYRLVNGQSVLHFHILSPQYFDKNWVNKAWNETVANRFLKEKMIDPLEYQQWMNELDQFTGYMHRLDRFKAGKTSRKPKKLPRSEYLLLPYSKAVFKAGNYMAKYISKDGGKIPGHLWAMSRSSKELTQPVCTEKNFNNIYEACEFVRELCADYKNVQGHSAMKRWIDYNDYPGFWVNNGWALLETYYNKLARDCLNNKLYVRTNI